MGASTMEDAARGSGAAVLSRVKDLAPYARPNLNGCSRSRLTICGTTELIPSRFALSTSLFWAAYLKSLIDSVFGGYYPWRNEVEVGVEYANGERRSS